MKKKLFFMLTISLIFFFTAAIHAQPVAENISLHGFAGWGFGITDGNRYAYASDKLNYDHFVFALNLTTKINDRITFAAQPIWKTIGEGNIQTDIDYAFASYRFGKALNIRIGKVKSPIGLYSEIYNVGTLRPFMILPQSMYGTPGTVQKYYNGIGLAGSVFIKNDWWIDYDVIGGQINLEEMGSSSLMIAPDQKVRPIVRDMLALRISILPPVSSLKFGIVGMTGKVEYFDDSSEIAKSMAYGPHYQTAGFIEYITYRLWIRTEYLSFDKWDGKDMTLNSAYFETAVRINKNWQLAGRYDWLNADFQVQGMSIPDDVSSYTEHAEWAFGLNFWISPNFVIKCSYHQVEGNFFANPGVNLLEAIFGAEYKTTTKVILFGSHISF